MEKSLISEKELQVIEELSRTGHITQREISDKLEISLGMVNIILKRLINEGYVKVRGLSKRRLQYILTPKGFTEKARKSYKYFIRTVNTLKEMKLKIQALIFKEYTKGERRFVILGEGELADIVEMSIKSLAKDGLEFERVDREEEIEDKNALILLTRGKSRKKSGRYLNVLSEIAR